MLAQFEEVGKAASTCTRCDLALTRRNVVFGGGNPLTPLVFIGEGPGENEDATGQPFVGRAGALLDKALAENGMKREHIYITNTVKCRPSLVEGNRVKNRPPRQEEMDACRPWLQQQLDLIKPLVIVCLGAPAANTIIHKNFKMTQERGQWFDTPYAMKAMAAFHPAYVLRMKGEAYDKARASLVADIGAARKKVIELKKQLAERPPDPEAEQPTPKEDAQDPTQLSLFGEE
ncbi:MAG: uracil-DNA glycosylase [Armatimonadetes bacterium]|nr:uracil-DNA glycosylase [Armatimonadota bacterium]